MDRLDWLWDGVDAGSSGVLALLFTVLAFWVLNARRGSLQVARPGAYVFANRVRLRLPLAFYNTGAVALIVTDLRVALSGDDRRPPLPWIAVLPTMQRSGAEDVSDFATPLGTGSRDGTNSRGVRR